MMTSYSNANNEETILFFERGTVLHVQIRDETEQIPFKDFVEIELSADLMLNRARRKHGTLEDCPCSIPRLQTSATSVNHAYTIISEKFEVNRQAKGGNVFQKVFYTDATGHWEPLGKKRQSVLAQVGLRPGKDHAQTQREDTGTPIIFDPATIGGVLNDILYDELLFAEIIGAAVEECEKASEKRWSSYNSELGRLFPFYHSVFRQFQESLKTMPIGDLMERWTKNVSPFIRGTWTGFFNNEAQWLISHEATFASMIIEVMNSSVFEETEKMLNEWIKLRADGNEPGSFAENLEVDSDTQVDDAPPQYEFSISERKLYEMADFDLARDRDEWHPDPAETCDYCSRKLAECRLFVDGREAGSHVWGNMCPDCFLAKGEGIGWGTGQLYFQEHPDRWLMVVGFGPEVN